MTKRFFQTILPFLLVLATLAAPMLGCGLLPPGTPEQVTEQAVDAAVTCSSVPDIINEVSEVLLNGGGEAELKKLATGVPGRTLEDVICAVDQLVRDWAPQAGAAQDPTRIDARASGETYLAGTGVTVLRE